MKNKLPWIASAAILACAAGCASVSVQGGDKPIHIVADVNVNIKVAHELDDFFAFQDKPTTAPDQQK